MSSSPSLMEYRPDEGDITPLTIGLGGSGLTPVREFEVDDITFRAGLIRAEDDYSSDKNARALLVNVSFEEDSFFVDEPTTGVYGMGQTADAAFGDFMESLMEYRVVLREERGNLSPMLAHRLELIEQLLSHHG